MVGVSLCRAAPGVGRSGAPSGADLGCSSEYSIRGCVRMCGAVGVCGGAFGVSGPPSSSPPTVSHIALVKT